MGGFGRVLTATIAALLCAAGTASAGTIHENFESATLPSGWSVLNHSNPVGPNTNGWNPLTPNTPWPAFNGTGQAVANFNATAGAGTISAWLITPLQSGLSVDDTWSFYTRKASPDSFADRLEVRMSTNGACSPGTSETDVGDFTTVLTEVNPTLVLGVYPTTYTKFSGTLGAMAAASGCLAFRYFVTDGGPAGNNSDIVSVDAVRLGEHDAPPPNTAIAGPGAFVASTSVTLTLSEPTGQFIDGFECNRDGAGFLPCSASAAFTGFTQGTHTVQARAVYGTVVDPTPASVTFFVDTVAPTTSLVQPTTPTSLTTVDLMFSAADPGVGSGIDRVQCRRDSTAAIDWAPCDTASTHRYTGLSEGTHTFDVRAVDEAGNTDGTPATATVVIDLTGPIVSITEQPLPSTTSTSATFVFGGGTTFVCRLDTAPFATCTSPVTYPALALGAHTFAVRGTDAVGNTGAENVVSWTIVAPRSRRHRHRPSRHHRRPRCCHRRHPRHRSAAAAPRRSSSSRASAS